MFFVEIIFLCGVLVVVECVNVGVVEYVVDRVFLCVCEDVIYDKLEVLDKAYIKSFFKLFIVDDFVMYVEGICRGVVDVVLCVIYVFWNGSFIFFDSNLCEMFLQLVEYMVFIDLVIVRMVVKDEYLMIVFIVIWLSLICVVFYLGEIFGKVYILDILLVNE